MHLADPTGVGDGTLMGVKDPGLFGGWLPFNLLIHGIDAEITAG